MVRVPKEARNDQDGKSLLAEHGTSLKALPASGREGSTSLREAQDAACRLPPVWAPRKG